MSTKIDDALTHLARNDSGRVLASLARRFNDLDLADEAVQEAMIEAVSQWEANGIPGNPSGWLYRVAQRKAIDRLRRADSARRRLDGVARDLAEFGTVGESPEPGPSAASSLDGSVDESDWALEDERLRLILLCCHPALDGDAQVALTLRLVGGLTTEEIAAAFLVSTPTLAARITRAKKKIRTARIPLTVPEQLDDRTTAVLRVVYLIFNEGYLSRSMGTEPVRVDLCTEAIRLADVVCGLVPEHTEAIGLAALQRFVHARRDARFRNGEMVLLDEQDRTLWHLDEITTANKLMMRSLKLMAPGPLQVEALIASKHCNARTASDTDWPSIVTLYDQLLAMRPSPIVALNRAASIAMADGPQAGLAALESVEGLDEYHLFHATLGELLARSGNNDQARSAFERARELTNNRTEQTHLTGRLADLLG